MRKTKALIFDLDGVLFDTCEAHVEAYCEALAPKGIVRVVYNRIAGMRTDEAIRVLLAENGIVVNDDDVRELTQRKREAARRLLPSKARVFRGSVETLTELARRYPMVVASSATRSTVEAYFEAAGTRKLFQQVLTGEDVTRAKPHPEIYLRSLELLSVSCDEACVIEDSEFGIQAAKAAHIPVIGVAGLLTVSELNRLGVTETITDFPDLLRFV